MTPTRFWGSLAYGVLLFALPTVWLRRRLERRLSLPQLPCQVVTSGRVALYLLARRLAPTTAKRVALVPDYICNVVPLALERAGFVVESYCTTAQGEPDDIILRQRLASGDVAVLLTASVFGSSAMLGALATAEWRALVERERVHVIVDLCQNLALTSRVPVGYGPHLSVVLSFNDKSMPGVMGGAVLSALGKPHEIVALTWIESRALFAMARRKFFDALRPAEPGAIAAREPVAAFEYSRCEAFPYAFETSGVSKLQIVMALVGLANQRHFAGKRQAWLDQCRDAARMPHVASSPFVVVGSAASAAGRRRKPPYAVHRQPHVSLRPTQVIVHNKGFLDSRSLAEVHE